MLSAADKLPDWIKPGRKGEGGRVEQLAVRSEIVDSTSFDVGLEEAARAPDEAAQSLLTASCKNKENWRSNRARERSHGRENTNECSRKANEGSASHWKQGKMGTWKWDAETDLLDVDEKAAEIFGWTGARVGHQERTAGNVPCFAEDRALTSQALARSTQRRKTTIDRNTGWCGKTAA